MAEPATSPAASAATNGAAGKPARKLQSVKKGTKQVAKRAKRQNVDLIAAYQDLGKQIPSIQRHLNKSLAAYERMRVRIARMLNLEAGSITKRANAIATIATTRSASAGTGGIFRAARNGKPSLSVIMARHIGKNPGQLSDAIYTKVGNEQAHHQTLSHLVKRGAVVRNGKGEHSLSAEAKKALAAIDGK